MFPNIAAQKRRLAETQRVHAVFGLGDLEAAIRILDQPAPARPELTRPRGREIGLEFVGLAKAFDDGLFQITRHAGLSGAHHVPELVVVPVLRGIVENAVLRHRTGLIGAGDDVLEGSGFPLGARDQLVAIVDIGLVVQVVVIFQRLAAHAESGQRIMGIGKIGKCESHVRRPSVLHVCRVTNGAHAGGASSPPPVVDAKNRSFSHGKPRGFPRLNDSRQHPPWRPRR